MLHKPVLTQYACGFSTLPPGFDGLTIAHLSDIHGQVPPGLVPLLRESQPELIAVTGDLIDSRHQESEAALALMEAAAGIAPCFFVPGNHESRLPHYSKITEALQQRGVTLLEDRAVSFRRKGDQIQLLGLKDRSFPGEETRFCQALEGLCRPQGFRLLLSHRPEYFPLYAQNRMDLILSGHAHGGQIRIPGVGGLFAPGQGLFPKWDGGVYRKESSTLVVSRGLANTARLPRLFNPTEVVLLTLEREP